MSRRARLADRGRTMVTTNDYGVQVRDVEALAPAGPRHVWVGDIGDHLRERADIRLHRVRVAPGPGPLTRSYRLVYPEQRSSDAASTRDGDLALVRGLAGMGVYELRPPGSLGEPAPAPRAARRCGRRRP